MIEPTAISISIMFMFVAGIAGGVLPQYVKLSDKGLHKFLALGTGMLLGTIFYHMLPEALHQVGAATFVLVGLLGVFVVERILVVESHTHTHHRHEEEHTDHDHDHNSHNESNPADHTGHGVIGVTAFAGLTIHALMVGMGLAAQLSDASAVPLMTSLLVHKLSEAFSLSTIFLLAGYSRGRAMIMLAIFASVTPIGILIGALVMGVIPHSWEIGVAGLAAGTFLYVALCDLLPEVFHRREGRWGSLLMLILGIALIAVMMSGGHGH